jgi:hypothetical protein
MCRWWRRSRRPGRPRIDPPCRDLIGRLADENPLWGAPRIHGELTKLGVAVSERTVSRYLRERPKRPSQTWRTFIANHLGQFEFNTQVLSLNGSDDDLVDASRSTHRASSPDPLPFVPLEGSVSVRTPCLGLPCHQHCRRDRLRGSTGRAPPKTGSLAAMHGGRSIRSTRTGQTVTVARADRSRGGSRSVHVSSRGSPVFFRSVVGASA